MSEKVKDIKLVEENVTGTIPIPVLPYQPHILGAYSPQIGIIGCGGISSSHLGAYKHAGYKVVAFCDLIEERAKSRRDEFYPDASITTDYHDILNRDDIEVVDIATHPADRVVIIEDALKAGKHVLSQKPFVLDLATGERLVGLAKDNGVTLAVNQNGRWAPHFSYMREAVRAGLVGEVIGVHTRIHWDHTWTKDTLFEKIEDLILYDFGIHWFDFVCSVIPDRKINKVYASKSYAAGQDLKVPTLAQVVVEFGGGQASLVFDGHTRYGHQDAYYIAGVSGSLSSIGPNLETQRLQYFNKDGVATPELQGSWSLQGFHGTMAELLSSIEEKRKPLNNAQDNLRSLALAFAAIASANEGRPYEFGESTTLWNQPGARP